MLAAVPTSRYKPFDSSRTISQSSWLTKTATTEGIRSLPVQSYLPSTYNLVNFQALIVKNTRLPEGLLLQRQLPISIKQEPNGGFFVEDEIFSLYGIGDNVPEALTDFLITLSEYFIIVEESLKSDHRNQRKFEKITEYINR